MHSNRVFKDAARFRIYKETGEFPMVTKSSGVDYLAEVLREDAKFPSSKTELVNHRGWKIMAGNFLYTVILPYSWAFTLFNFRLLNGFFSVLIVFDEIWTGVFSML